jgi:hypothetical protein
VTVAESLIDPPDLCIDGEGMADATGVRGFFSFSRSSETGNFCFFTDGCASESPCRGRFSGVFARAFATSGCSRSLLCSCLLRTSFLGRSTGDDGSLDARDLARSLLESSATDLDVILSLVDFDHVKPSSSGYFSRSGNGGTRSSLRTVIVFLSPYLRCTIILPTVRSDLINSRSSSRVRASFIDSFVPSFTFASGEPSGLSNGRDFDAEFGAELPGVRAALLAGEDVAESGLPRSFSLASSASILGGNVGDSMSGRSHRLLEGFFFGVGDLGFSDACSNGFVGERRAGNP